MNGWKKLNLSIERCQECPRLVHHCQHIAEAKRKAYQDECYWGRPVPNFGKSKVPLLIVGLAPGAHGANRTGRMFTGDRSGDWLYRALYRAGFCNQAESVALDDGLRLKRSAITAVCHCAPPDNKPAPAEITNCSRFLIETIELARPRVFLALGSLAWTAIVRYSIETGWVSSPRPKFGHGATVELNTKRGKNKWLVGCYHPSQQNTFTGRLTETMLDKLMCTVKNLIEG